MSIEIEQIRISAKNLGELAMPNFCPRCFWVKLNCKLPYQIFPGIFSSIDSYSKKITWGYYEKYGELPGWLKSFGDFDKPIKAPGRSKFFYIDEVANVKVTGVTDEIVQKKDGSYFIIDYKTAKFTGTQDELLPMYEVQLNCYALIAEGCDLKPVTGIGLAYYEPMTALSTSNIAEYLLDDGFKMPFNAHLLPLELNPQGMIVPLLKEVRKLGDMRTPPDGVSECKDCPKLDDILKLLK
jgi:hypothetical protein